LCLGDLKSLSVMVILTVAWGQKKEIRMGTKTIPFKKTHSTHNPNILTAQGTAEIH